MKTKALIELPSGFPGMQALEAGAVYLMGCRSFDQYCCTVRSLADPDRFCPFCPHEFERRGRRPLICVDDWMLIENEFPHKNVAKMLLVVPREHVTRLRLSPVDWADLGLLIEKSGIEDGGVMLRFGDPRLNVGTVEHLHFNIIEPICGKEYRAPFAKELAEHEQDYARTIGFQTELIRRGGLDWLFSEEGIAETQPKIA